MLTKTDIDIVVVGGGGAGLAAASEAARLGLKVLLLEKDRKLGGSTAWSVGSISATGTPHQKRAGIEDSPDAHFADMGLLAGSHANRDNLALRRLLVDNIRETMDWLMSTGLEFVGPMPEPPHRQPRMHNVLPNSRAFPYHLRRDCRSLGVQIRTNVVVDGLIEEAGRIAGVSTRSPGKPPEAVRAKRGVILAGGDFSANPAMKEHFGGPEMRGLAAVNPNATGEGIAVGLAHGGTVVNGDIIRGPILRFIPPLRPSLVQRLPPSRRIGRFMRWAFETMPPERLRPFVMKFLTTAVSPSAALFREGAILVTHRGGRFTDELHHPAADLARQPRGLGYLVFDATVAEKFSAWPNYISTAPGIAYAYLDDYRRSRKDIFHCAGTPEALAKKMGMRPRALSGGLQAYNDNLDGVPRGERRRLLQPPFYGLGPVRSHVVFTDGGLAITERMEVKRRDGSIIAGLYAAGSNGQGGVLLEGHGHHLGWAFVSGRLAARAAAQAAVGR